MSSIVELGIVDSNIDPKGIGRIRVKLTGDPTGPIEKSTDYEPWSDEDPFVARSFLTHQYQLHTPRRSNS